VLPEFSLWRTVGLAYPLCVTLSVVIIAHNEEANIGRTLASVQPLVAEGRGEIILVDSGSSDDTVETAKSLGAKVFVEEWKGYAAQKNSAIEKATGAWILSLDADEEVDAELVEEIGGVICGNAPALTSPPGFRIPRKNFFLGRWIRHGGFWPDPKLRLFRRGAARFEDRAVHEDANLALGSPGQLKGALLHHSYPTLADYIDHMNRYSSLGAEMAVANNQSGFSVVDIVFRPAATFIYNYIFRLGFLDGREGWLLHLYHAVYVSWKYAKAWELANRKSPT
jgi:glycosyltransferase involved in cell wall biosynthesis